MKRILFLSIAALAGCATQRDVDLAVLESKSYTRAQIRNGNGTMLKKIDAVDQRINTLRNSVLSASEIRMELHREYWGRKLDEHQQSLDALRQEVRGE